MIRACAPSNIALIKYWGKRHTKLNLPLTSSFSVSLTEMCSWTTIREASGKEDVWEVMGDPSKAKRLLALAREATEDTRPLQISIENTFPGGAGLASSASSMASLARGLNAFLADESLPLDVVAGWARIGSGSSVRSLLPGYVLWEAGVDPEGRDCIVKQAFDASQLPLSLVVCVVNDQPKPIGSTAAMERCRDTSPNYQAFHEHNDAHLAEALAAVEDADLARLGAIAETNCLAMHDVMHQAQPPVNYFLPGTHAAIAAVRQMRQDGIPCFFSIDAGPNVKVFCPPDAQADVLAICQRLDGIKKVLTDRICSSLIPVSSEKRAS